ncbi:hypothetical protein ES702_01079 [subsurface metagenome]
MTNPVQVDVGTVKNISAEAIRVVLWILGFMSFGYGTKEFEVTTERLGCYRPEEHIDNPKDYADNEDARRYDRRLRAPIDEERELAIDPELGLKAYIASENLGIDTSAGLVRKLFGQSIELGRRYARNNNKADLYEALRLLGTGCHCLEDFSAHSNFTELVLIELGERNIFPHVGRNCKVRLRGARSQAYPLVTGTFGGVDFLHSVTGEFDDKVTQSEIQELEGTLQQAQQQGQNSSVIQDLLKNLPDGIFGGKDEAGKADELKTNAAQAAMANSQISPREPEEWLQYINDVQKQIYPIIEWHDEIMQSITETIDKIPILPDIIEKVQEQVNIFVFSLLAPFMLPIISQIKTELNTGSSTIIQSSVEKQHIVFSDDECSDPTHSMLSKDHFSNVLNEPAGKVAGQVLRWVVPQLIAAWDDESIDINRTLNRIIRGVFHHPALRQVGEDGSADGRALMFGVVEQWWQSKSEREKDGLRDQLSREGVEEGRNHKPGVHDHGHGSAKKLGMPNVYTANHQGAPGGFGAPSGGSPHDAAIASLGQSAGEAVGGGVLGSLVGGLTSAVGRGVVAGAMGDQSDDTQTYNRTSYGDDGSRTQTVTQLGGNRNSGNYNQSQYSRTDDRFGGRVEQHTSFEQQHERGSAYSGRTTHEQRTSYGGTYSETRRFETNTSSTYGRQEESGGGFGSTGISGGRNTYGQQGTVGGFGSEQTSSFNRRRGDDDETPSYGRRQGRDDDDKPKYGRRDDDEPKQTSYGRRKDSDDEKPKYGRRKDNDSDEDKPKYGRKQKDDDDEKPTYGRKQKDDDDDDDRPKYGRKKNDSDDERPKYGRQNKDSDDEKPKYGRKQKDDDDDDRPKYGRKKDSDDEKPKYGRRKDSDDDDDKKKRTYGRKGNDDETETSGYGRQTQQSGYTAGGYGQQSSYGRNERSDEYGSGTGYGQQTSSYGRTGGDEYGGGRQEQSYGSSGFGRNTQQDEYSSGGGFGNTRRRGEDASEEMPGGFGAPEEDSEQTRSYGRRRGDDDENRGGYGGRRYGGGDY